MGWKTKWNKPMASVLATAVLSMQVLGGVAVGTVWGAGKAEATPLEPGTESVAKSVTVDLRIMSTTDVHTNVYGWDYFKDAPSVTVGLDRTATLVTYARDEQINNLLLDNGDLIQGTPLGTYVAQHSGFMEPKNDSKIHPMIAAMNIMKYDAATMGNHEFNYGLEFLKRTVEGSASNPLTTEAKFPYLSANVYKDDHDNNPDNDVNAFEAYQIIPKVVKDKNGVEHTVKVGLIGLVTPQIMEWDKVNLEGKVIAKDIAETARKFIPKMKSEGAEVIVAMAHSGFDATAAEGGALSENAVNELSKVQGIDAITFSHTHKVFPTGNNATLDVSFKDPATGQPYNQPGVSVVDNVYGHINGTPAVQAGYGGAYLGLIDLKLEKAGDGKWEVNKADSKSSTRSIYQTVKVDGVNKNIPNVDPNPAIDAAIMADHEATRIYTDTKLGETTAPMNSYFAMVQDDPTVQIVTDAQKWYVGNYINTNLPQYKDLPILSVGAPFKAGRNGPSEYTAIKQGNLTIRSASDLYLYDNTLKAIKVKGSTVKEWLEMSAGAFNTIKPELTTEQPLLSETFQVFNFDVIDGIKYRIDVTKEPKYGVDGKLINPKSSRVKNVTYNGAPLNLNQEFIVVTNNYRASGGGNFPTVKGSEMIVDSQEENRQILMDYITAKGTIDPTADGNWSLAPLPASTNVTFTSTPDAAAVLPASITDTGKRNGKDFGIYKFDLSNQEPLAPEDVEVHLIGINDFHGQLDTVSTVNGKSVGTAAILATYLKEARAKYPNTLLFHNGDSVGASAPVSSLEKDEPTMEWMNLMKFDVGSLGNHEFDQGVAALKAQIFGGPNPKDTKIIHAGANFDYINANAVDAVTGKPIIKPYVIKNVGGIDIGFIGLVTKSTPSKVSPAGTEGVRFLSVEEEVAAVNKYAKELQDQGVETIIVLAHDPASTKDGVTMGEAADLAKALPADSPIDVIVAGDNHALANGTVNNKLIVQAYSYGTAFEDIKLVIDSDTKDVKEKSATVESTFHEGVTPDAETAALVKKYLDKHPELTKPVGTTDGTVTRTDTYTKESALGNLIADAMRSANFEDGAGPADFAFMNPGGIRADLPSGNVTFGDLAKVQPFGNTLVKLTLTGAQIKTLLEQQWNVKADGTADIKTLQISGLKYTANMYLPVAERISSLTLTDGTPINPNQNYTAVVNNFMAAGGDNYKVLTQASKSLAGPIDLDVFYNYIVKTFQGGPIKAAVEGRITNNMAPVSTPAPGGGSGGGGGGGTVPVPTATPTPKPSATPSATPAATATATPAATAAPALTFKDLGKVAWAKEAIESLYEKGIIKGLDANNFAPAKNVTRAEFVTMLVRALNLQATGAASKFSDVKADAWYTEYIAAAVQAELVKGTGNGKFEPGREITREEMAIMVANALKEKLQPVDNNAELSKFGDKASIASYAKESVAQLTKLDIINGVGAAKFAPKSIANRAQAAVIVYRMLEQAS
ncbi:bifunctional 2',3'-cyclic-nucleotide 2'-phosphodiesterase/3'-nucleotidase [Paenibacillus albidus]|uniref:bifunctional 2',3'-cyclic-nucleotide 2'-phosphodiesterase/3'-nucleotidase n=1 Tax=Paenibacillus albidus TaxID=2041023 RepID=UPI001BE92EE1|nr:bifunctional 2',3'-cyclic-nucleotide 2'-phosphodiesterase/3'-nucleotidase [Paenibacillus albidus]MBT2289010.1 bifunctional 2',3'-cyclic-nucleotide 2'-phosphodiesterase/3'-nucleotidase [Paenibacillus albidus]